MKLDIINKIAEKLFLKNSIGSILPIIKVYCFLPEEEVLLPPEDTPLLKLLLEELLVLMLTRVTVLPDPLRFEKPLFVLLFVLF